MSSTKTSAARHRAKEQARRAAAARKRRRRVVAGIAAVALLTVAVVVGAGWLRGPAAATPPVSKVDVATAQQLIASHAGDSGFEVLDVRTPAEFAAGHIAGAVNVDLRSAGFTQQLGQLDRGATYLVYCHTGNRSAQAAAEMHNLHFDHVNDLEGGITAWTAAGGAVTA
jgi:rhodanese-related sulfurtransferase